MSATARASRPDDDASRPGGSRAPRAPRTTARTGPRTASARPAAGRTPSPAAAARPAPAEPATPRPATGPRPAVPAPVPGPAASGPVHTGGLRARPSRPVPRPGPAAAEPRRRSATGARSGRTARRAPFVLLVAGLLVGTTLALLFLNTAIAVNSLKANQLRADNTERTQELERLEQQVVTAGTPQALAAAAAAAGLVPAGTPGYLVIGPDGAATLRGTPVPAEAPAPPEPGAGG